MFQMYNDTWTSADGEPKKIGEMHTAYITNCIVKLVRHIHFVDSNGYGLDPVLPFKLMQLRQELQRREIEDLKEVINNLYSKVGEAQV